MAVTTFPIPNSGIRCPPGTSQVHSCDRYFVDVVVVVVPGHRDRAPNNRSTQGMGTTRQGRRVKSNSTENLAPLLKRGEEDGERRGGWRVEKTDKDGSLEWHKEKEKKQRKKAEGALDRSQPKETAFWVA
ncbi:hypothetical protein RUM44_011550 [Polyplax serrata]|uniref:Uncharacterized protein n=1 Tax=Polyplax serrata TaxID=468196 RepID=A0ABR1AQG0_POLSC